ncbi:mitochondrial lysine-tRNA synthetase [Savitreella phatthalungensis]
MFADVAQGGETVQMIVARQECSLSASENDAESGNAIERALRTARGLREGDHVEIYGMPIQNPKNGQISVSAEQISVLSQCLHRIPQRYDDVHKRLKNRHIDFLVNEASKNTMLARSRLVSTLRRHLESHDFIELETPVLQSSASGATARPFVTTADALSDTVLQLRIAPELALKRAIVGGFERVFEIGKSFRNEGLSRRHNPEFTTCEFYAAYWGLDDLLDFTKSLLRELEHAARQTLSTDAATPALFDDFQQLDFLSTIETRLGRPIPDVDDLPGLRALLGDLGMSDLVQMENTTDLPMTRTAELSASWDALGSRFIEPLCKKRATFVMNAPACMAPLAKSAPISPGQPGNRTPSSTSSDREISCRFELFVKGIELINAYEEENSATVQRMKFANAASGGGGGGDGQLTPEEASYCNALEWGMPPTAGWGMGIDRLVMLLADKHNIAEVLLQGGLRYQAGSAFK